MENQIISNHDFWKDLDYVVKDLLKEYGVKYSNNNSPEGLLLDFLTVRKKLVDSKKRKVFISPTLKEKLSNHPRQAQIEHISKCLENGFNVNFFQSETLFQSKLHDHLQYEWNIHHFHLSSERKSDSKFYKRTKELLFVYITNNKAILLDVKNHNRKEKSVFADSYWIEILHNFFPDEIKEYRDTVDMPQSDRQINAKKRLELWDKGYSPFMYTIDGITYTSPGIGRTTSGHSVLVIKQQHKIIRWIHYANKIFRTHFKEIKQGLRLSEPKLQLTITEQGFSIVDHEKKQILLACPYEFDLE